MSYSDWTPAISAQDVFKSFVGYAHLQAQGEDLYWIEIRPQENGRYVIVRAESDGTISDLTPPGYSARSRVYEYGGMPFTVHGMDLYFVNFKDQRIYHQDLRSPEVVRPISPEKNHDGSLGKYMSPKVSPDGKWLAFVYERELEQKENQNFIAALPLSSSTPVEPIVLAEGADFYSSPYFSNDGQQLSWLQWNHPYMPWNSTQLYTAKFGDGKLTDTKRIVGEGQVSISSLTYGPDNVLYFAMDFPQQPNDSWKNYYNVYKYEDNVVTPVTKDLGEYAQLQPTNDGLVATLTIEGESQVVKIFPLDRETQNLPLAFDSFGSLATNNKGQIFAIANSPVQAPQILRVGDGKLIRQAFQHDLDPRYISTPQKIKFPTKDGEFSYGYLYLPQNKDFEVPSKELPPVRVILHGGPTSRTSTSFSLSKVFWTSQGFAIFDVNYRGSTGFGRRYRDALQGQWGLLEVSDVHDGLKYLRQQRLIGDAAFVSGGSAGGYSVQRLLTYYPDLFKGGASHFGIGNLVTLQKLTHKFESRYLSQLIGGTLETNLSEYESRSPINHLDQLKAPMIIFQGADDKVVPPENSREMAAILKKRGIYHEYYEYEGEGHGFLKKENLIESLSKESAFFKRLLKVAKPSS